MKIYKTTNYRLFSFLQGNTPELVNKLEDIGYKAKGGYFTNKCNDY